MRLKTLFGTLFDFSVGFLILELWRGEFDSGALIEQYCAGIVPYY